MPQKYQFASPGLRQTLITAVTLIVLALLCIVPAAAEEPVEFGGGPYSTAQDLAKALGDTVATASGNTLTLKKDINITGTITITGDMTILGDGHTIYRGGEGFFLISVTSGTLTLGSGNSGDTLTIDGQNDKFSSEKNTYGSILVDGSSSLVMKDGVTLKNTTLTGSSHGSAVVVQNGAAFTMKGGLITQNTAGSGAVNIVDKASSFLMSGGEISGNTAKQDAGGVSNLGTFTMSGGKISGNEASGSAGGVFNRDRGMSFTMTGGEISGNKALKHFGGGVFHGVGVTFTLSGGEISDNTAPKEGGGIYSWGTIIMTGGNISGNTGKNGGGVYNSKAGTFTMSGGEISGNKATDRSGGVQNFGTFTLSGGNISGNTASNSCGGVYNSNSGTFTLKGGTISDNTAKNGGGVLNFGKFTMTAGNISGNTARGDGGGVYHDTRTFTMSGGNISGNEASSNGGGIFITDGATFDLSGGEISGNKATNRGGGVCFYRGTITMSGGEISGNSGKYGAAIMVLSSGVVFKMTGGEISGNKPSSTTGSTIYLSETGGADISLTGGSVIDNIGSGLTCNGKSTVTVGGSILFSNNTGGPHLSFDKGGTLNLTGGTFKKGEHGSSALDMKNTNIYLSGPVTFDADLPFDVLSSNGLLTINGDFTGSIKSFNLQDENLDGKDFIKIDSNKTSQKPSELINRFALSNTNKWTLVADDTTNTIKTVLNKPKALSGEGNVTVKWINATIANVSIRLDPNANDATDVFVKLGDKTSQTRTGTFTKGSTISDLQITGLTAGTTYSVTAVLKNSGISNNAFTYTDILADVQAPTPAAVTITGEGGAEIPSTGILLPQGKSMTFGVLVTDQAGNPLKDEPVTWEITGGKTSENERTATTITLTGGNSDGPDTLKATTEHGQASGIATITVTTEQPTKLSIEADKESIALGDTVHLTAVATDDGGEHFGGYTVQWTGSATATSKTGTAAAFTPTTAGSYSLTATVSDPVLTAQKTITVTGPPAPEPEPQPPQPTQPPAPSDGSSGNMDNAFRVLFETSGGSFISPATGLSYGDTIPQPPAPTKDGCTFGGWYTDETCTKEWSFSEGIPGDITLYAKWTKTSGSDNGQQSKPTTQPTAKPTTVPETTKPTASPTTTATAAGGVPPTLTQAPAPIAGALLGLLAAGALLRRKD